MAASTKDGDSPDAASHVLAKGVTDDGQSVSQYTTASPTASMAQAAIQPVGQGQPHDNMMPSLVINFQIALYGVYPSRN
ncbi:MAG: hypothetical protein U5L06_06965 [Rhodovibrio sp.]|nr:hypothetical protein [Rhodovibrio sp.]